MYESVWMSVWQCLTCIAFPPTGLSSWSTEVGLYLRLSHPNVCRLLQASGREGLLGAQSSMLAPSTSTAIVVECCGHICWALYLLAGQKRGISNATIWWQILKPSTAEDLHRTSCGTAWGLCRKEWRNLDLHGALRWRQYQGMLDPLSSVLSSVHLFHVLQFSMKSAHGSRYLQSSRTLHIIYHVLNLSQFWVEILAHTIEMAVWIYLQLQHVGMCQNNSCPKIDVQTYAICATFIWHTICPI